MAVLSRFRAYLDERASVPRLWVVAILLFLVSKLVQTRWLDAAYAASRFPVPFYEGQTTFDAAETKGHFQVLIDEGTLDLFRLTQGIDFVYIAVTFAFTVVVMAAIYSMFHYRPRLQSWAWWMVLLMPFNAIFDVFENLVSFVMLANPTRFADWLVLPYSSFAVGKFAVYLIGYLWIVAALAIRASDAWRLRGARG